MRRFYSVTLVLVLLLSSVSFSWGTTVAPKRNEALSGIKTIGINADYSSISTAITDLNTRGVQSPGVTFLILPGTYLENPPALAITGYSDAPIIFRAQDFDSKPTITPGGGANSVAFKLLGSDYVTFDGIVISSSQTLNGFWLEAVGDDGVNHVMITSCTISLPAAQSKGINSLGSSSAANNNSTFRENVISAANGINVENSNTPGSEGSSILITQNLIQNSTIRAISVKSAIDVLISSNRIELGSARSGIYVSGQNSNMQISNNIIQNGTAPANMNVEAIYISGGNYQINDNTIRGLSTSGSGFLSGICIDGTGADHVFNNKIYNLSAGSTGVVKGINILGSGIQSHLYNNMIYDLRAPSSSIAPQVTGISINPGATTNIYYNSILLNASGSNSNFATACLYIGGGSMNDLRNNIMINLSTPGSGSSGRSVAFWKNNANQANISTITDRNVYYSGTPGPKNLIYHDGTNSFQTIEGYQGFAGNREQHSFSEMVPYMSIQSPYDLHINPANPTRVEGAGLPIHGITFDIDNEPRALDRPDLGADEGAFCPWELSQPLLRISIIDGIVMLEWDPVPGATGYHIYGSEDPQQWSDVPVATTNSLGYAIPSESRCFYYIKAYRQ